MGAIDADAHVIECEATFEYLDPEFRRFKPWISAKKTDDVVIADNHGGKQKEFWVIDGRMQPMEGNVGSNTSKESREMSNIAARLEHMDELEIDVQVLYPTVFLRPWTLDPICEYAICKAYNRWLADIWKAAPTRLKWVAMVPLMSMDKVESELRFAKDHGCVGIFLRGLECEKQFSHAYFFRLYELAQELDLAICIHSGNGSFNSYNVYGDTSGLGRGKLQVVAAFHSLLLGGIPGMTRRKDTSLFHHREGSNHANRNGSCVPLRHGAFQGEASRRPQHRAPLYLFLLPDARRRRGLSQGRRHHVSLRRGRADALPIQHRRREALLLLQVRHLHAPSAAFEHQRVRRQCGLPRRH